MACTPAVRSVPDRAYYRGMVAADPCAELQELKRQYESALRASDSMSSRCTTNRWERKRGDLSSFSLNKGRWTRGMQPTSACLTTSGFVYSVLAKLAENQSEAWMLR